MSSQLQVKESVRQRNRQTLTMKKRPVRVKSKSKKKKRQLLSKSKLTGTKYHFSSTQARQRPKRFTLSLKIWWKKAFKGKNSKRMSLRNWLLMSMFVRLKSSPMIWFNHFRTSWWLRMPQLTCAWLSLVSFSNFTSPSRSITSRCFSHPKQTSKNWPKWSDVLQKPWILVSLPLQTTFCQQRSSTPTKTVSNADWLLTTSVQSSMGLTCGD